MQYEDLKKMVEAEFPICLPFKEGIAFWNGHAPIVINKEEGIGYYTSILAIDTQDKVCKEFVMTGCYSYDKTPEEQFNKKKDLKKTWWNLCEYFNNLEDAIKRYNSDRDAIQADPVVFFAKSSK